MVILVSILLDIYIYSIYVTTGVIKFWSGWDMSEWLIQVLMILGLSELGLLTHIFCWTSCIEIKAIYCAHYLFYWCRYERPWRLLFTFCDWFVVSSVIWFIADYSLTTHVHNVLGELPLIGYYIDRGASLRTSAKLCSHATK